MKDLRNLKDLTIHDVKPARDEREVDLEGEEGGKSSEGCWKRHERRREKQRHPLQKRANTSNLHFQI